MPNYLLHEMPDMSHTGKKKVYPKLEGVSMLCEEQLIEKMLLHGCPFSKGTLLGVLTLFKERLAEILAEGYNVQLKDLGIFSLSLAFDDEKPDELVDEEDPMTHRKVTVREVNFRTDRNLLHTLQRKTKLYRKCGGVMRLHKKKYTPDERLARALDFLTEQSYITLKEYRLLNNLSAACASVELKRFSTGNNSPLVTEGAASHKRWKKR